MLVLLVSDVLPPQLGGIETALSTILNAMPDVRFIVLTRASTGDAPQAIADNVEVRRIRTGDAVQAPLAPILPPRIRPHSALISEVVTEWHRRRIASTIHAALVHLHSFASFRQGRARRANLDADGQV